MTKRPLLVSVVGVATVVVAEEMVEPVEAALEVEMEVVVAVAAVREEGKILHLLISFTSLPRIGRVFCL